MGDSSSKPTPLHEAEWSLLEEGREYFSGKDSSKPYELYDVQIENQESVHTLRATEPNGKPPVVLVHGYGAGIGMWFATLPLLARVAGREILSIDLPGCGLSSRPKWEHGDGSDCDVDVAESFFVDRIEQWRASAGLEKMVLASHSLGGYLSVCYAEKYPERVDQLILISPAGVPHKPPDFAERVKERPWFFRLAGSLWESGHSPFSYANFGPGRWLIGKYVNARFNDEPWIPKSLVTEYTYLNWTQGEVSGGGRMHATLLDPGAFARKPLCERIPKLPMKVDFIYGTTDWMDYTHALALGEDQYGVMRVKQAGHNVMVDNPMGLVEAMQACLVGDKARHGAKYNGDLFRLGVFQLTGASGEGAEQASLPAC